MSSYIKLTDEEVASLKEKGCVPVRKISPHKALFETLFQDAVKMVGFNCDKNVIKEVEQEQESFARRFFEKVFQSDSDEYLDIMEAFDSIYDRIEKEVERRFIQKRSE